MTFRLGDWLEDFASARRELMHCTVTMAVLQAITRLGLLDHLDQPMTAEELAERAGADPQGIARILTFLAAEGVVDMDANGRIAPTQQTAQVQALASTIGNYRMSMEAGLELDRALTQGGVAFQRRFGQPVFEYLRDHPEQGRIFEDVMRVTTREAEDFLFAAYDFPSFTKVVDVGGNQGSFLTSLLNRHPGTSGVLFDLPATADSARAALSKTSFAERVSVVGGSFFEAIPNGGDLYLLKQILHDWDDDACGRILAAMRTAMDVGTPLVVIERLLPDSPQPCEAVDVDILMLMWTSGRERSAADYGGMLEQSGFAVRRVVANAEGQGVIEAVAV